MNFHTGFRYDNILSKFSKKIRFVDGDVVKN